MSDEVVQTKSESKLAKFLVAKTIDAVEHSYFWADYDYLLHGLHFSTLNFDAKV